MNTKLSFYPDNQPSEGKPQSSKEKRNSYKDFVNRFALNKLKGFKNLELPKISLEKNSKDVSTKIGNHKLLVEEEYIHSFLSDAIDSLRRESEGDIFQSEIVPSNQMHATKRRSSHFNKLEQFEKVTSKRHSIDLSNSNDILVMLENVDI